MLTNLATGDASQTMVDAEGNVPFTIEKPADYRLLRYGVK